MTSHLNNLIDYELIQDPTKNPDFQTPKFKDVEQARNIESAARPVGKRG